jgi:Aminoglycoside adenylyltransferase, C-terminal domain
VNDPRTSHNPSPTQFPELNELLRELTDRAADILGDNIVGAYLQGSFAVGDADMHSDCDFLIPVHGPITPDQEAGLRALHDEIPTRPGHWTQHLEGSYPDKDDLRTLDGLGRPWLYIDHGWREMQWSTHCNTEVVRWSLRECGVTLTGPHPKTLVDPVRPEVLRARMREYARNFLPDLLSWTNFDIAWAQRYAVTTLCRILHTFDEGQVTSKKAALLWANCHVDPQWSSLVQQVLDDRQLGWDPDEPPRRGSVEQTLAFVQYVQRRTGL